MTMTGLRETTTARVAMPCTATGRIVLSTTTDPELHDITDELIEFVVASGVVEGTAVVFCPHTSCGLTINEDEQGFHEDLCGLLENLAPRERYWAHDDLSRRWQNLTEDEPPNGHSHTRACFVTHPSITIPIDEGRPVFGRWQRLFLVELDKDRERTILMQVTGHRYNVPIEL